MGNRLAATLSGRFGIHAWAVYERRVRYSPAPEWTPLYGSPMAEEWRVSLVIGDGGSAVKGSRYRDLLRARLGDDVMVSAGKMHLFLYAGSAKAADEAGQVARAVLEEQGRFAEIRLERWDRSAGEWRDPDAPAEHEDRPEPGRLETTAIAFIKGAGQALARGDLA
jgi:hypothetical protein